MSLPAATFDHRARVWAQSDEKGPTFRETVRGWKPVEERVPCMIYPTRERRDDTGGGERTTGEWKALAPFGAKIEEGDVLEVYAGPMAPVELKVDQVHRPGRSHTQCVLVDFSGRLET